MHDAPGSHVEMPDLAVAHLIVWQPHIFAAGVNQRVGIFPQQPVVSWFASERNGVCLGFGAVPPAVEDGENERFGTGH